MRKDLGSKMLFMPLPVVIIGTYDKDGKANAMNAAWSGIYDTDLVYVCLSKHKTTDNLELNKAFTIQFATTETVTMSDYFGLVSGNKVDKIKVANAKYEKGKYVNAPILTDYPVSLECKVEKFGEDGILVGKVVNLNVDEKYLKNDGKIDFESLHIITYEMVNHKYRTIGNVVADAFSEGKKLMK